MVAATGIEPVTRGFSIRNGQDHAKSINYNKLHDIGE
jgi:hypothetical protein